MKRSSVVCSVKVAVPGFSIWNKIDKRFRYYSYLSKAGGLSVGIAVLGYCFCDLHDVVSLSYRHQFGAGSLL